MGNPPPSRSSGVVAFVVAVVVVFLLPHIPFASLIARPLVWLSTLAHEGGHGVASLFVGGGWAKLQIFPDASGVMTPARGVADGWRDAVISLGGLIGPAVVAAVFFVCGVVPAVSRAVLVVCALGCAASLAVDEGFAVLVAVGWGVVFAAGAVVCTGNRARVAVLVLAVELAGSVFSRSDYLFVGVAHTGAGDSPSVVAQIADALGGHYLVWGSAIAGLSVVVLVGGAVFFFAGDHALQRLHDWRTKRKASRSS